MVPVLDSSAAARPEGVGAIPRGAARRATGALLATVVASVLAAVQGCSPDRPGKAAADRDPVWETRVAVDSGGGHVGPWRMNESDWRYVDDPAVALTGDGSAVVAWVDQARRDVLLQVFGPDGEPRFIGPVDVSRSPGIFSWLPRVRAEPAPPAAARRSAGAGTGGEALRVHVLWQEIVFSGGTHGGEAFYARSTDGGRTFGEPVNLSRSPAGDGKGRLTAERWFNGSLDLALGPGERVLAAWTAYEGPLWLARSTDGGATFSDPVRVGGNDSLPARGPDLAVGPGDTVHLAWSVGEDPSADLRLATSSDGGLTFGDPRRVHPGRAHDDAPKIAVDGRGTLHLAWGSSPDGPRGRSRILYARSRDGGASFDSARLISAPHGERFRSVDAPELAAAGGDTVLVSWGLYPSGPRLSRGFGHTASVDGGDAFADPRVIGGTLPPPGTWTGSLQGSFRQRLAAGGGRVAFGWSTFRPDETSRVRLGLARLGRWLGPAPPGDPPP